jgi:hypothetical protein
LRQGKPSLSKQGRLLLSVRSAKRSGFRKVGLSQADAEEILKERDAEAEAEAEAEGEGVQVGSSSRGKRRYKTCGKTEDNKRTCQKDAAEIEDYFKLSYV